MASKSIINAYCVLSALFFAACAYAQLNDPDPTLWVLGYIIGGCLFNYLVMVYHDRGDGKDAWVMILCRASMNIFAIVNASVIIHMMAELLPKIDFALPLKEMAWSVLEFEEGREIAGLLLLLSHVMKLWGFLLDDELPTTSSGAVKKDESPHVKTWYRTHLETFIMFSAISGALYLWVYYQPEMNARYKIDHCCGAFRDIKGDEGGLSEEL